MGRPKVEYRSTGIQSFKAYKQEHPNINITYQQFNQILRTCNAMIVDHILDSGEKFRLPYGFGDLSIHKWIPKRWRINKVTGKQVNNYSIDWKKTREKGKHILHLNYHTQRYKFRWVWFISSSRLKYAYVFTFKPNRAASRKLAQYLKIPNSPYVQIYRQWDKLT